LRLALALFASLFATPALAEWVATQITRPGGNNAAIVDGIARTVEQPPALIPCPGATPPFAYSFDCKSFTGDTSDAVKPATLPPKGGLPDGTVAFGPDGSDIHKAWYADPTDRYGHGALGDGIEGGSLVVELAGEKRLSATLPRREVFEDRTPRIVDLDGSGQLHILTIIADRNKGAAVAVYKIADGKLTRVGQTPFIGRSNRWLNIAGFEDFDGSGRKSVTLVKTPHLAGILQFWRWEDSKFTLRAEQAGFSNHQNRSREQRLSAVADFDGDGRLDLALPSLDRRSLQFVRFVGSSAKTFETFASVRLPARIDKPIVTHESTDGLVITIGLDDTSVYAVHRK
jgi:hypothetical protein